MVVKNLTFDEFADQKNQKGLRVYVFLLMNEYQVFNDNFWLGQFHRFVRTVRCSLDDFKVLDIGVHPKTFLFKDGKEVKTFNGIPDIEFFHEISKQEPY